MRAPRERGHAASGDLVADTYATRRQQVTVGRKRAEVFVAAFPVASGEVLFQLADEGELRRGGVYLLPRGAERAHAPRFDEIFRDVAGKARSPLARGLRPLVERAQRVARATRPRLTPSILSRIVKLGLAAARLDARHEGSVPGLPCSVLVLALALIFVSEEERYPRPRFKGSDVARERLLELLADPI